MPRDRLSDVLARIAPKFSEPITDETPLTDEGLGLDSLALADLLGAIEHEFFIHIREEDIGPDVFGTVGRLRRFLESRTDAGGHARCAASETPLLKVLQRGGDRPPFIMVNGDVYGTGALYCFTLARLLGPAQPFYSLSSHGTNGGRIPPTIEDMAADHLRTLRSVLPAGPYLLGGYSHGALVAFEMARQLVPVGHRVPLVVLIDMFAADPAQPLDFTAAPSQADGWLDWRRRFPRFRTVGSAAKRSVSALMRPVIPIAMRREPLEPDGQTGAAVRRTPAWRRAQWTTYVRIVRDHIPGPYAGPVTVMVARRGRYRRLAPDRSLGWDRVAPAARTILIPGDHLTSVSRHTATVARHLGRCFARVHQGEARAHWPSPR
jgi:thioesterase domain-containing protein/acyl carrier protein